MQSLNSGFKKLLFKIEDELEEQFIAARQFKTEFPSNPPSLKTTHNNSFVALNGERLFQV